MNPIILQTIQTMAGVTGASGVSQENKEVAQRTLGQLLQMVSQDADDTWNKEYSQILS